MPALNVIVIVIALVAVVGVISWFVMTDHDPERFAGHLGEPSGVPSESDSDERDTG